MTSHDVVDVVRRTLGTRKVGHAGTLDPMATGLLVLGVGRATRLLRFLGGPAEDVRGVGTSRRGDHHARRRRRDDRRAAGDRRPRTTSVGAMAALVGDSLQTPPAYSAVKVGGRKLYEAARKGEVLGGRAPSDPRGRVRADRVPRTRTSTSWSRARAGRTSGCSWPTSARCSGCGAHLTRLRRTAIGSLDVADAVAPDGGRSRSRSTAPWRTCRAWTSSAEEAIAAGHGRILGPAGIDGAVRGVRARRNAHRGLRGRRSRRLARR